MKLFIQRLLCLTLLLTVGLSCGKNSSGKKNQPPLYNQYVGIIPSTSQQPMDNLRAWYTSTNEGTFPTIGQHTEERRITTYSSSEGCSKWAIFTFCLGSSSNGTHVDSSKTINILATGSKATNSKLAVAMAGTSLELVNVSQYPMSQGAIYTLVYKKPISNHLIVYTIDTGINSAFNPIRIEDTEAKTVEKVRKIGNTYLTF
ncbi:MAG TPA: hypothetical protein VNJ01_02830 [Bacteriovoracaceae bacterium]|nr:hypothetical protein [Bacteriovoracaceae bacterium]